MKKVILIVLSMTSIGLYLSCGKDDDPTPVTNEVEITNFSPTSGAEGTEVTINGKNFSSTKTENTVTFNGTSATVKEATATSIKVDVPNGATTGKIKIVVGSGSATSTADFSVLVPDPPSVSDFSPMEGGVGTEVTINGANFSANTSDNIVKFGTVQATVSSATTSQLIVIVPEGATTAKISVDVNSQTGTSTEDFTFFTGRWTQRADFGGEPSSLMTSFVVGNKAYVCMGEIANGGFSKDFWVFDPAVGTNGEWTKLEDEFPGLARWFAAGFVIEDTLYISTGLGSDFTYLTDLWAYHPDTGWVEKSSLPASGRLEAAGFAIGNKGYIGLGISENEEFEDFWEYDPADDSWTQKTNFGGGKRSAFTCFVIGDRGYVGTGTDANNNFYGDFWEFDPSADTWTQKADFAGAPMWYSTGFSVGDKGYMGIGYTGSFSKEIWEYDAMTDSWTKKNSFKGSVSSVATGFSIGDKGYIVGGYTEVEGDYLTNEFWEFAPDN